MFWKMNQHLRIMNKSGEHLESWNIGEHKHYYATIGPLDTIMNNRHGASLFWKNLNT